MRAVRGWGVPEGQGMPRSAGPGLEAGALSHRLSQGVGQVGAAPQPWPSATLWGQAGASLGCQPVGESKDLAW